VKTSPYLEYQWSNTAGTRRGRIGIGIGNGNGNGDGGVARERRRRLMVVAWWRDGVSCKAQDGGGEAVGRRGARPEPRRRVRGDRVWSGRTGPGRRAQSLKLHIQSLIIKLGIQKKVNKAFFVWWFQNIFMQSVSHYTVVLQNVFSSVTRENRWIKISPLIWARKNSIPWAIGYIINHELLEYDRIFGERKGDPQIFERC
jgi:hypothetical protein